MGLWSFVKDLGRRLLNSGKSVISKLVPLAQKVLPFVAPEVSLVAQPLLNIADNLLNNTSSQNRTKPKIKLDIDSPRLRLK